MATTTKSKSKATKKVTKSAPVVVNTDEQNLVEEIRNSTIAVRLRIGRFGASRSLDTNQRKRAADEFAADVESLSARKRLINTKDVRYQAVTSAINKARKYWHSMTVEFPDDGIRLLRSDRIDEWENGIATIAKELHDARELLDEAYQELKIKAKHDLGELYSEADYPTSISQDFHISYEYPTVEPDQRLMKLHPAIFKREQERVRQRFEDAIKLTEQAFIVELQGILEHMVERLTGTEENGKRKIFRDSAITNFHDFLSRFRQLNVGSNQDLEKTIDSISAVLVDAEPEKLRKDVVARDFVATQMNEVKKSIDTMLINRPKRKFTFGE